MLPAQHQDARPERPSLHWRPPMLQGLQPVGNDNSCSHAVPRLLSNEALALGKRKRLPGSPQSTNTPTGLARTSIDPANAAQPLPPTNSTQVRSTLSHRPPSLQISDHRVHQHSWGQMSPPSETDPANTMVISYEQDDSGAHFRGNTYDSTQTGTPGAVDMAVNGEHGPWTQEGAGTASFVHQLQEHANGHLSADAVLPSPAASDDSHGGFANDPEKQKRRPHLNTSSRVFCVPQRRSPISPQQPLPTDRNNLMQVSAQTGQLPRQSIHLRPEAFGTEQCTRKINEFVVEIGGEPQKGSVVKQRLDLLRNASRKGDLMYLVLHQIMCTHTVAPDQVPYSIQSIPNVKWGFAILDILLSQNDRLPMNFLRWATSFPTNFARIVLEWSYGMAELVNQSVAFITLLSTNWEQLRKESELRQCPPTLREIVNTLKVHSSTLQLIIFLSILRSFWGPHVSPQMIEAETTFKQRQARYSQNPTQASKDNEEERAFVEQLQRLYRAHKQYLQVGQQRGQSQSSCPPPQLSGSRQSHLNQNRRQSASMNSLPRIPQSAVSQRPSQTWEFSYRQLSPMLHPGAQHHSAPPTAQRDCVYSPMGQMISPTGVPFPPQTSYRQNPPLSVLPSQRTLQATPPQSVPLYPRSGEVTPQAARVNPSISALHQAHLRTPVPIPSNAIRMQDQGRLYQFVTDMLGRRTLQASRVVEDDTFEVSEEVAGTLPLVNQHEVLTRTLAETSHLYRLRCVRLAKLEDVSDDALLFTADTTWPEHVYFQVNGTTLEVRRKKQWNKDLPVDITHLIHAGQNSYRVLWNTGSQYNNNTTYATVIEAIGIQNHKAIKQNCTESQSISSTQILDNIKLSLSPTDHTDDSQNDDIAVIDSNISINLFDPFVRDRICEIPVRGKSCLHRDCFDLETFLNTRPAPRDAPQFSTIDEWRCPLCKGDARPQNLIVDGFLMQVSKKLEEQGLLDTKTILVEQDGNWKPKEKDTRDGARKSTNEVPESTKQQMTTEVIDLGDDED